MSKAEEVREQVIAAAITDYYGERCQGIEASCELCKVWLYFDAMCAAQQRVAELERAANAWNSLMSGISAITAAELVDGATGDERLNAYIAAWERQKQRAEAAEARVAELERKFCELREAMERAKRQLCSIDPELRHMQPRIGAAIKLLHEEVKSDLSELQ